SLSLFYFSLPLAPPSLHSFPTRRSSDLGFMVPGLKCYVLDEPFAGINPTIKDAIIELIEQENRARQITFLIVSHEMAIVRRLCRSEEHTSELQSRGHLVCRLLLEKKKKK